MGHTVFPIVEGMRQWGERFLFSQGERHSVLVDNALAQPVEVLVVRSKSGKTLNPQDCHRRLAIRAS